MSCSGAARTAARRAVSRSSSTRRRRDRRRSPSPRRPTSRPRTTAPRSRRGTSTATGLGPQPLPFAFLAGAGEAILGDWDLDGRPDFVYAEPLGGAVVLNGMPRGSTALELDPLVSISGESVVLADYTGDGRPDL